jgi:hypothetical protein
MTQELRKLFTDGVLHGLREFHVNALHDDLRVDILGNSCHGRIDPGIEKPLLKSVEKMPGIKRMSPVIEYVKAAALAGGCRPDQHLLYPNQPWN